MSKFQDEIIEQLYAVTLDGLADEEIGTADGFGYFARVGQHIIYEFESGFVQGREFATEAEAESEFQLIVTEALQWEEATGREV
jgi:hypothetical protein